ncbi:isochorismatase family protein [Gallaecimonas mangrovi]|uniref:isochorismatase family protein n=1 Tax=Gallaecimonas mangrovi TaxID=2291597 RepID=UPI000E1FE51D|nr:isochorismatase family protein [Gallaecimonas mangrovi]
MSLSPLDEKVALVVIDLQKGIVELAKGLNDHDFVDDVISKGATLAEAFRAKGLPVVLVNVAGGAPGRTAQGGSHSTPPADWADLLPELKQQDSDILITKKNWGAFINTDLHDKLQAQGVTQVVVMGIATSIGVESTARQAYELGYNVALVTDAMADVAQVTHNNSIEHVFPRLAECTSTQELLDTLKG